VLVSCQQEQVTPDAPQLRSLTPTEQSLITNSNQFTFELIQALERNKSNNYFLSPYYINMTLSMTLNGAEKSTLEQMQQVMSCNELDRLEINKIYSDLNPFLLSLDNQVQFTSAHAIWHHPEAEIRPLFRDMMIAYYQANVEPLDFAHRKAPASVVDWVKEHIGSRMDCPVPSLLPDESIYLIDATYLKGRWTYPFAKESTAPGTFLREDGEEVITPMMYTDQATYLHFQDDRKVLVDLPYGNQQYSMTIIMPHRQDSLSGIVQSLSAELFDQELSLADTLNYPLYLPKFSIGSQLTLKNTLIDMGMSDAFGHQADFSGIFGDSLSHALGNLIHYAGIEVDEIGTQTVMPRVAAAVSNDSSPIVRFNRPFLFLIREKHSNVILYAGAYQKPE